MCGRYSLNGRARSTLGAQLVFHDQTTAEQWDRYNVAPSQMVPVIRQGAGLELVPMLWGFVPGFIKDEKPKRMYINARAETVASNGYFRSSFKARRCLVPATGYYEWQKVNNGKQPYNIHLADESVFLFAGIWDRWHDVDRVSIITTTPNTALAKIHDRMPVIIPIDAALTWLSGNTPEMFLEPIASGEMLADPVSVAVGNVRSQGEVLLKPVSLSQ